jgi:hypothetical protein
VTVAGPDVGSIRSAETVSSLLELPAPRAPLEPTGHRDPATEADHAGLEATVGAQHLEPHLSGRRVVGVGGLGAAGDDEAAHQDRLPLGARDR